MNGRVSNEDVVRLFEAALAGLGGSLHRHEVRGDRVFLRGTLDVRVDLGRGSFGRPGVALRIDDHVAEVAPYLHRPECAGGVILVEPVGGALEVPLTGGATKVAHALVEAVAYVAAPGPRGSCVDHVRATHELPGGVALDLLDLSDTVVRDLLIEAAEEEPGSPPARVLDALVDPSVPGSSVRERLRAQRAATAFGLLGAAVDAAREASDPDLRWRLESLAGEIAGISAAARLLGLHDRRRPSTADRVGEEPVLA